MSCEAVDKGLADPRRGIKGAFWVNDFNAEEFTLELEFNVLLIKQKKV